MTFEALILRHLNDPTHEMHVAFSKLPLEHKWLLFSVLECGESPSHRIWRDTLAECYGRLVGKSKSDKPFDNILRELTEGFLTVRSLHKTIEVDWIHPSCRDLTLAELVTVRSWRAHYLTNASSAGIAVALSIGSGPRGDFHLPLLTIEEDWNILESRCSVLQKAGEPICDRLSRIYQVYRLRPDVKAESLERFRSVLENTWQIYYHQKRSEFDWDTDQLASFLALRAMFNPDSEFPGFKKYWTRLIEGLTLGLSSDKPLGSNLSSTLNQFSEIINGAAMHFSEFFLEIDISADFKKIVQDILRHAREEESIIHFWDEVSSEELDEIADEYEELSEAFWTLSELPMISTKEVGEFENAGRYFAKVSARASEESVMKRPGKTVSHNSIATEYEKWEIRPESLFEDL